MFIFDITNIDYGKFNEMDTWCSDNLRNQPWCVKENYRFMLYVHWKLVE